MNGVGRTPAAAELCWKRMVLGCQFGSLWKMSQLLNGCVVALDVIGGLATFWASGSSWQASSPMGVEIMWVPSHYKISDWQPELPWELSADECRQLNSWADGVACTVTSALHPDVERNTIFLRTAHAWAAAVFERQWKCTQPFHKILRTIMSRHDDLVL